MSIRQRRREFLALLGGTAAWPLEASAQQAGKLPTIGYLGATTPASAPTWDAAFVQRLRELGWIEGRTVVIEYRWAEGRTERYPEIAAEFVRLKVDVIATSASAAYAAKQATSVIPIVFFVSQDPVGAGLVASLARPAGNVTGLSTQQADTAGKRVELLHEVVPGLRRLAILVNVSDPGAALEFREVLVAARTLGLEVVTTEIRRAEEHRTRLRRTQRPRGRAFLSPHGRGLRSPAGARGRAGRPTGRGDLYIPACQRRAGSQGCDLALGLEFPPSFHLRADLVIE
jgi:putative ABC transport system substrate-binding protein